MKFRLMNIVVLFEVVVTVLVSLGIYFGFTVFPFSSSMNVNIGAAAQTNNIHASLPLYMPSLTDLKVPYTIFQSGGQEWNIVAILISVALFVLQSFVRGMYLGGLKGWVQGQSDVSLIGCGRRYWGRMLMWSVLQLAAIGLTFGLAIVIFPIGVFFLVAMLVFSLTPYLLVLQDLSLGEALRKSPRITWRYLGALVALALLAMLCTLVVSLTKLIPSFWGYVVPLMIHAWIGTWLIGELMNLLHRRLQKDHEELPQLHGTELKPNRSPLVPLLLAPVLVVIGGLAASGQHISLFDWGKKEQLGGIAYSTNFSDVFFISEHQYSAYTWRTGEYHIDIRLPELSADQMPDELRGIAHVHWDIDEEVRRKSWNTTSIYVESFQRESKLMYRLVREKAEDGSVYYSSLNGAAAILPGDEDPREPLAVQISVSGDGKHVYLLQYPARFSVEGVFRVSEDGQYLTPETSQVNPADFHTYWFSDQHEPDDVFRLLASKNAYNYTPTLDQAYIILAVAMQEADGHMVVSLLEMMRQNNIQVSTSDWDGPAWTKYLQDQYAGADLKEILEYANRAGLQSGYQAIERLEQNTEQTSSHTIVVSFPRGVLEINFELSKEDGRLLAVSVPIETYTHRLRGQ